MPKISIIVPVYKVEKYLHKCVDSILKQTFKDFELILVDDGSPDRCGEICDEYARKDNRVRVIHKENGGVSDARNVGIDIAKGEYIGFVDSDDYIELDMYEFLYDYLIKSGSDISICGIACHIRKNGVDKLIREPSSADSRGVLTGKQAFSEVLKSKLFSVNPVNKLFKAELFSDDRFPKGKISEDAFLIPKIILKAKKVVYDNEFKYYYVRRNGSITTAAFSEKDYYVIDAYRAHLNIVKQKYPELLKEAEFRYLWSNMYVLDKMFISSSEVPRDDYDKILKVVKKNFFKVIFNPCFSLRRKMAILILFINKNFYKKLAIKVNSIT